MSAFPASNTGTIPRRSQTGSAPLSFGQEQLWLIDRATPGTTVWNVVRPFRLRGPLDVRALQRAVDALCERHESLRTIYEEAPQGPRAVLLPATGQPIRFVDLGELAVEARAAAAERFIREEQSRAFDLTREAPLRAALASLAQNDHVLCVVTHHIVSDGWSKNVMFRDLSALYASFVRNGDATLAPLPMQFSDYAAWERSPEHEAELADKIAFWRAQLAGAPHAVDLPTDRPRPLLPAYDAERSVLNVPPELVEGLTRCAREHGATLYIALLATYAVLLSRYSGQSDVLVGSPIVGRANAETEDVIGFFANTLVLRAELGEDPSFAQLLVQLRHTFFDAYERQDVPVEQLMLQLRNDRQLTLTPLVNVILTMEDVLADELDLPDVAVEPIECDNRATKFDFTLLAARRPEGLRLTLWYRADLFEQSTADGFLQHFRRLLQAAVTRPSAPVSTLPIVTESERSALVGATVNRQVGPEPVPVPARYAGVVSTDPDALALVCDDVRLTFAELDARAARLQQCLVALGVEPRTVVGLALDRSADAIAGIVGIWRSGAAYVPLPPELPAARLAAFADECGLRVIVTDRAHQARVASTGSRLVLLDDLPELPAADAGALTPVVPALDDLAYVIFTSGSTGAPKGVAVTHGNLANYVEAISQRLGIEPNDRWRFASVSSLGADLGNTSVFAALATGGTLFIIPADIATDAERYATWAAAEPIDVLKITPSHLAALLARDDRNPLPQRWLVLGGEVCPPSLIARVQANSGCAILNHYGPTETTIGACSHRIGEPGSGALGTATVPIGTPLAGVRCYVLDRHGEPVPSGIPGELCIGGAGVAQGYFRRPDLTNVRFVPDPFSPESGARMYRTGDRVRRLPNGLLEFLGRTDDQVKIRGYRVELDEVASALGAHPDVLESAAAMQPSKSGEARLVAYATLRTGAPLSLDGGILREWLGHRLPDYMVPAAIVLLQRLPLKPNGKIDRNALPEPKDATAVDANFVAPRTPTEERIAEVWQETLGVERVGVTTDFLSLGFHSILAIRALDTLGRIFSIRVPIRSFFESKTIERLAVTIDAEVRRSAERELERNLALVESLSDAEVEALLAEPVRGDGT